MGKEDVVLNQFYDNGERFADVFNGILFQGEQVIRPEDLREGSERYNDVQIESDEKRYSVRYRDIKKYLDNGVTLRILALEAQLKVDYTMPWRCMDYDAREYGRQLKISHDRNRNEPKGLSKAEWLCGLRREERLVPTFTICLYHGVELWDGPRSLKDMMDFGEDGDSWESWFADYPMRLVCVNELDHLDRFQSSVRDLYAALQCREDKDALRALFTREERYSHMDEDTAEAMVMLMKDEKLLKQKEKYKDKEGQYNMCKALMDIREEGRREGELLGRRAIRNMLLRHMPEEEIISLVECDAALIQEVKKDLQEGIM